MNTEGFIKWKARELYQKPTKAEVSMKDILRSEFKKYGIWFDTSVPLFGYITDFYCGAHRKIAIEVDGSYHNGRGEYDDKRDKILQGHGITTIRVSNHDVQYKTHEVIEHIKTVLNKQLPLKERGLNGKI